MALLKSKEIRAMRPDDVRAKFKELSDELMHERGVAAMGGAPASPGKIRALRTEIARIHTVMREMEVEKAVKANPVATPANERAEPKKAPARIKKEEKKTEQKEETE